MDNDTKQKIIDWFHFILVMCVGVLVLLMVWIYGSSFLNAVSGTLKLNTVEYFTNALSCISMQPNFELYPTVVIRNLILIIVVEIAFRLFVIAMCFVFGYKVVKLVIKKVGYSTMIIMYGRVRIKWRTRGALN